MVAVDRWYLTRPPLIVEAVPIVQSVGLPPAKRGVALTVGTQRPSWLARRARQDEAGKLVGVHGGLAVGVQVGQRAS